MATIKIKNLKRVQTQIKKKIIRAAKNKKIRQGVGKSIVNGIRKDNFGAPSEGYLEWRKRNENLNKTHDEYRRSKINITFTGELLEDLEKNVKVDTTGGGVDYVLEHTNKLHKAYKTTGGRSKSRSTYQQISKGIQKTYKYLTFTKKNKDNLLKYIKSNLFKLIK